MQDNLQEFDLRIEQLKEQIALSDALTRLEKNKDFKKVFLEHLFEKEAVRLVSLIEDPTLKPEVREQVLKDILHISALKQTLIRIHTFADMSRSYLEQTQEAREEFLQEQAQGEEV